MLRSCGTAFYRCDSVPPALECAICRSVLKKPAMVQPCLHIFCHSCLQASLRASPICPLDRLPIDTEKDVTNAPRNIQEMLDELNVQCEACGWRGTQGQAEQHDPAEVASDKQVSVISLHRMMVQAHLTLNQETTSFTRIHPCPQSLRGCTARLDSEEALKLHAEHCPFVTLSAYFDIQDSRATLLHAHLSTLSSTVQQLSQSFEQNRSDMASSISTLQASLDALDVKAQLGIMDESIQLGQQLATMRAGLEGVRRQLFGLLMERESRVTSHRLGFGLPMGPTPATPNQSPPDQQSVMLPHVGPRTESGTKL